MITGIYAIKDAKSTFMPCTVDVNDATAVRNFEHAVRQPGSLLLRIPTILLCISSPPMTMSAAILSR